MYFFFFFGWIHSTFSLLRTKNRKTEMHCEVLYRKRRGLVVSFCRESFLITASTDSQVCKDCGEQKMENETLM